MSDILIEISESLYKGDSEGIVELVNTGLDQNISPSDVLTRGLLIGMDRVSNEFKCGDLYVPEVIMAAKAMHAGMNLLRPLMGDQGISNSGKFVIGTVQGDLHDIGKSLVKLLLEGAGFTGIDLGVDVSPDEFLDAIRDHKPDLLAMSALLTTTMVNMKATINALEEAGLRDSIKVIVGGAPVTLAYANDIGADGYAPDAARAVNLANNLIKRK